MVQFGDSGAEVSEVQKLLSMLGYDLIVDGNFGNKTLRSIKAFQKKYNLAVDGIVGKTTLIALKAAQKRTSKELDVNIPKVDYEDLIINTDNELPAEQFIKQITPKSQIFIHFTAGRASAKNCIAGWNADEPKIATAFVIDGDTGIPHEAFNPDYWGWHLGMKGTNGRLDKASIGIEICCFGPLKEKNGKYYAWPSDWTTEVPKDKICELDNEFRGFRYFYSYSDAQMENLEKLLCFLIERYNIKVQSSFDESWFEYKEEMYSTTLPGIWTHVNVRKDKSDSYPDHRLLELLNRIAKKYN
jgi:N-acetyl-anhydromuramyl-L-alanine amidase AmpD